MTDDRFWNPFSNVTFTLPAQKQPRTPCHWYSDFKAWAEEHFRPVLEAPDFVKIQHSKWALTEMYRHLLKTVPKAHQRCTGERSHRCIYHAWSEYMHLFEEKELFLDPRPLFAPPAPPVQVVETPGFYGGKSE
jgi:hypothetical protein